MSWLGLGIFAVAYVSAMALVLIKSGREHRRRLKQIDDDHEDRLRAIDANYHRRMREIRDEVDVRVKRDERPS